MQFLKIIFWAILIAIGVMFSYLNWIYVPVFLLPADPKITPAAADFQIRLPLLLLITFLLGLLPTLVLHRAVRWNLRRKLENAERSLETLRAPESQPGGTLPPSAAPIAAPPGVS
jgi:hypothetical protein